MAVQLKTPSLDLGIVTDNGEAMVAFYEQTLGFPCFEEIPLPNIGVLKKLAVGDSVIKIMLVDQTPALPACRDGIQGAVGYRYCAVHVSNLEQIVASCKKAGHKITIDTRVQRPGCRIAVVEDPDGNNIEFIEE
jgi:catechol 2,3-dioxygenase-like lactoylglutathione lyase family enzyme